MFLVAMSTAISNTFAGSRWQSRTWNDRLGCKAYGVVLFDILDESSRDVEAASRVMKCVERREGYVTGLPRRKQIPRLVPKVQ
jgi:hypothetical protein